METAQTEIHEALEPLLDLGEGEILTGWVVVYEYVSADGAGSAGHVYGPEGMTSWRALGLLEWAKQFTINRGDDDGEEES